MTDPHTPATAEAPPPPPLASMETLGAWTKEVQSKFMERYKAFLAAKPAPTRRAVLRILLQNTDASIGEVRRALNHAYRSTRLAGAIQAALTAHAAGDTQALANVRDPGTGTPTPYASADVASQHVRELNSASHLIRRDTPARLEKIAGSFPEIDAVLGDVVGTPEDAIARVAELEAEIASNNVIWQERITALEVRFDQVATGAVAAPKPAAPKKPAPKKPAPKKPATPA